MGGGRAQGEDDIDGRDDIDIDDRDDRDNRDDRATTTAAVSSTTAVAPTACRNAWVLSDGRTVEARDWVLTRAVVGRRTWNSIKNKCPGCGARRHPDAFVASRESCATTCKRAFRPASTTTHWVVRNKRRKKR